MDLRPSDPNTSGGREYDDDPTHSMESEKTLWYLIAELDFGLWDEAVASQPRSGGGQQQMHYGLVNKGSMEKVRVMSFVINNTRAANSPGTVRKRLRQLFLDVARYQVDYLGGDANAAIYRYYVGQPVPSIATSSLKVMLNTFVGAVNTVIHEHQHKIHAGLITSNSQEDLDLFFKMHEEKTAENAAQELFDLGISVDCVVGIVISWGHSTPLKWWRQSQGPTMFQELDQPIAGYPDFEIRVAEFPFDLENKRLWLITSGNGDCDWYTPLFVRLRTIETKNKRKRTEAAKAARQQKDWERYQQRYEQRGEQVSSSSSTRPTQTSSSSSARPSAWQSSAWQASSSTSWWQSSSSSWWNTQSYWKEK
jgi:hypothetical protein